MAAKLIPIWVVAAAAGGMTLLSAGVSYLMRPKSKLGENKPNEYATNIVDTDAFVPIAFGKCVLPILINFMDTNPDDINELHGVATLCMGPIEEIDAIYFNNMEVIAKRDGDHWEYHENYAPPMLHFERRRGVAADATAKRRYDTVTKLFKKWTSKHLSAGIASFYMLLNYDQDKLNSIPIVYARGRWQKVLDVRDDTEKYSNNPALCLLHYLTDTVHGKGLSLSTQIIKDSFIAEANYCDESIDYIKVDPPEKIDTIYLVPKEKDNPFTAGQTYYFKYAWARGAEIESEDDAYDYYISALSPVSSGVAAASDYGRFVITSIDAPGESDDVTVKPLYMSTASGGTYYWADVLDPEDTKHKVYGYKTAVPYAANGSVPAPASNCSVTFEDWSTSSLDGGKYYRYKATFKTADGETAPSPATKKIKTKSNQKVIKIKLPETEDKSVTHVVLYRTEGYTDPGEHKTNSDFKKVAEIAIGTNYHYDTLADGSLGAAAPSTTTTLHSTIDRFNCNGLLDTGNDQDDNIEKLLSSCRGRLYNEGGRYRIFIPKITVPETYELTPDNIIGDWEFTIKGMSDKPNVAKASFINPKQTWKSDTVIWPKHDRNNFYLKDDNDFKKVVDLDLPFTTNKRIAKTICQVIRKVQRNNIIAEVTAMPSARILRGGNLVMVTHPTPGWTQKKFWVDGVGIFPNGTVRLILSEYTEDDYNYETLDEDTLPGTDTDLGDPQDVPDEVTSVVITEELFTDSGVPYWRLKVSFTNPTSAFWKHSEVYVKPGDSSAYSYYTEVNKESNGVFYIYPIEALTTYYLKFLSVSTLNAKYTIDDADEVTEWSYTVTPTLPPRVLDLEVVNRGNESNVFGKDFVFRWTPVSNYGDGTATNSRSHMQTEFYEGIRYLVEIFYSGINSVVKLNGVSINSKAVRTVIVSDPKFTYTLEDNIEDAKKLWEKHSSNALYTTYYGIPLRQITIKVTSMNSYAQKADKSRELTVTNQSPDMQKRNGTNITPEVSAIKGGVAVQWSHPYGEYDISHFQIWLAAAITYFTSGKRQASKAYGVGARIYTQDLNGFCYRCTVAGTTSSSETPTFPVPSQSTPNPTYVDGSVTWICDGALRIVNVASIITVESTDDDVDISSYSYEFKKLDPKTTLYTKIYPFDVYGKGTASEVASGTPGNTEDDTNSSVIVPAQPAGLALYPKTKSNTDGKTVVGIMAQWNKNSETDIDGYILEWRATSNASASSEPTPSEVDAGESGIYDVEGGSYELWLDGEIGSGSNESTTYCRKMLKDIQNDWKYFVRVRAVNTSGQRGSFSSWVSLVTSKANNAADTTAPNAADITITKLATSEGIDITVTMTSPPSDLAGFRIAVKANSDFTNDADRVSNIHSIVDSNEGKAKVVFYGSAGTTYYITAQAYDNSKNYSAWKTSETSSPTGATSAELSKAYSLWRYKGSVTSSANNKVSWTGGTGNELVKKKNDGTDKSYTVTAQTDQTVTNTMFLTIATITSTTATFQLTAEADLASITDPVVIAKIEQTTGSKCNVVRYVDDNGYSVASYKGGFNRLSALFLDASEADLGAITGGTITLNHDSGGFLKFKDSSGKTAIRIKTNSSSDPDIVVMKQGEDADNGSDAENPSKVVFSTKLTINGSPVRPTSPLVIESANSQINSSTEFVAVTSGAGYDANSSTTQYKYITSVSGTLKRRISGDLSISGGYTFPLPYVNIVQVNGNGLVMEIIEAIHDPTNGSASNRIVIKRTLINNSSATYTWGSRSDYVMVRLEAETFT